VSTPVLPASHAARGARALPRVALAGLLVLILGITVLSAADAGVPGLRDLGVTRRPGAFPALPPDLATRPLGSPVAAPSGAGGYRVLERQDDGSRRPVRWDPCRPIHYVVRPDGAPPGGEQAIAAAADLVGRLTGLRLVAEGGTDERPAADRRTVQRERYGNRWAPVLVAWTDAQEYPPLGSYAGLGGPDAVAGRVPGHRRYVSGVVLLNRRHLARVVDWPGGRQQLAAVVLHEFGHLVGLDHVGDPGELMAEQPTPKDGGFAAGDRRGLAALSDGPCFRDY
jgi:hypothetical protein